MSIPSRASSRLGYRRLILPAATLIVAGLVFLWQQQVAPQRADQVRAFVEGLLAESPSSAPIAGTEPIISTTVRARLAELKADGSRMSLPMRVDVLRAPAGMDQATHAAAVSIDPLHRIVLRVRNDGGTIVIVGVEVQVGVVPGA